MEAIVTANVFQNGSTIVGGKIVHWVIVRTNLGYAPQPGLPGFGTVVATIC
jgi:hypothetical protein